MTSDEVATKSEVTIKRFCRKRDGFACIICGMTADQHQAKHGRKLEVHRVIPGSIYHPDLCQTLCMACHDSKPRVTAEEVLANPEKYGITERQLSLYAPDTSPRRRFTRIADVYHDLLVNLAKESGRSMYEVTRAAIHNEAVRLNIIPHDWQPPS